MVGRIGGRVRVWPTILVLTVYYDNSMSRPGGGKVAGSVEGGKPCLGQRVVMDQGRACADEEVVGPGHIEVEDGLHLTRLDQLDPRHAIEQAEGVTRIQVSRHDPTQT